MRSRHDLPEGCSGSRVPTPLRRAAAAAYQRHRVWWRQAWQVELAQEYLGTRCVALWSLSRRRVVCLHASFHAGALCPWATPKPAASLSQHSPVVSSRLRQLAASLLAPTLPARPPPCSSPLRPARHDSSAAACRRAQSPSCVAEGGRAWAGGRARTGTRAAGPAEVQQRARGTAGHNRAGRSYINIMVKHKYPLYVYVQPGRPCMRLRRPRGTHLRYRAAAGALSARTSSTAGKRSALWCVPA
jgi:hypothetical protein